VPAASRQVALLAALAAGLAGCAGGAAGKGAPGAAAGEETSPRERLGIEVQPPRLAAAGYLVELRYRVLDAGKAAPLAERGAGARLVDQATREVLGVAGAGAARPAGKPEAGKVYSIYFDNSRRRVAAGARVTLELGGAEIGDLAVGE
jgi:hypothetical protein